MYITKIYIFAISAAILDLENSHYFLNISVITQIEFINTEMYVLVQQIHIRLCLKLPKTRKLIVIWGHLGFLRYFSKKKLLSSTEVPSMM